MIETLMGGKNFDVNAQEKNGGGSIFYLATQSGDLKTVKLLMSCDGLDVNAKTNNGRVALMKAVASV